MKPNQLSADPFNLIITGVGGQGNVLASRVLGQMLAEEGYQIVIGETFGGQQRGRVPRVRTAGKSDPAASRPSDQPHDVRPPGHSSHRHAAPDDLAKGGQVRLHPVQRPGTARPEAKASDQRSPARAAC